MRMQDLRCFLILAEELNFTRAAARAYLSQQAFSARIKALETKVGVPLFTRTTRHVSLTPEGSGFVGPAREALGLLDAAVSDMRATANRWRRPLRVGIHIAAAGELTPYILDAFAREAPSIPLEFREFKYGTMSTGVDEGIVDLALARLPLPTRGLSTLELIHEPIVLAISRGSPLAQETELTVERALQQPVVVVRGAEPEYDEFSLLHSLRDTPPLIGATVDTSVEEVEAVAAGRGCSFVPALVSRVFSHPGIRYLPIVAGPRSTLVLVWRHARLRDAEQAFIDVVRRVVDREVDVVAALEAGRAPEIPEGADECRQCLDIGLESPFIRRSTEALAP